MKRLLIGFTLGAITGMVGYRKMQENKLPEKAIKTAREKLNVD